MPKVIPKRKEKPILTAKDVEKLEAEKLIAEKQVEDQLSIFRSRLLEDAVEKFELAKPKSFCPLRQMAATLTVIALHVTITPEGVIENSDCKKAACAFWSIDKCGLIKA